MQVEGTGKWPNDNTAMAKMKAALGCELAAALEAQLGMYTRVSEQWVDVYAAGFAFRLLLWSDRDEAIADRAVKVLPGLSLACSSCPVVCCRRPQRESHLCHTGQIMSHPITLTQSRLIVLPSAPISTARKRGEGGSAQSQPWCKCRA